LTGRDSALVFLSFVYICIAVGGPIIKERVGIPSTGSICHIFDLGR
jgi:hypothetical protein